MEMTIFTENVKNRIEVNEPKGREEIEKLSENTTPKQNPALMLEITLLVSIKPYLQQANLSCLRQLNYSQMAL